MKKTLQVGVRLGGLRHVFTVDDLDPRNSPALIQQKETIRAMLIAWANDPTGLDAEFDELVDKARRDMCQAVPELRTRFAIALTEH